MEAGMWGILFFIAALSLLFLVIEIIQRKIFTKQQWSRKATHILSGGIIIWMPYFLSEKQIVFIAILFLALLSYSKRRKILSLHRVDRFTIGELLYPLSIGLLSLICLPEKPGIFQASVLILALSDGLAGVIGEWWNFRTFRFGEHTKSLGGSIVFFITSLLVLLTLFGSTTPLITLVLLSLALTLAEFFLVYGSDNLAIPLLAAWLLIQFV